MAGGSHPGAIRTFLIADIRGYTAFTQAQGDEAAARLAARFAEIIRETVEDHSGQLLELRGDEALCVFDSPRGALRSGVAAQRRFADEMRADPSMPLRVGMGIDAGEAVPVESGYRGGALNLAARLCGQARPGEVLVSEGVVHLARRVEGIEYAERGRLDLKGLPEVVRAFEARFELQLPEAGAPSAPRRGRLAAAVAIPVVLAIVSALVILDRPETNERLSGNDMGAIDPESGRLRVRTPIGGTPGGLVAAAGSIWVTNSVEDVVRRIDPETGAVSDTVGGVGSGPTSLAFGDSSIWVVDEDGRAVRRIDPDRGEVVGPPIEVGNGPSAIAFGEGGAWVVNALEGTVSRIDPERSREIDVIAVGADPAGIAVGEGSVWVAVRSSRSVLRIDPGTGSVVERFGVGNEPAGVAVEGGTVWVTNATDGTITRVEAATGRVRTFLVGGAPGAVRATPSAIWAALPEDGAAARVDVVSGNVRTVKIGGAPIALDISDGELWVASAAPPGSHIGGTLRVVRALDVPSLDPAAFSGAAWSALTITNDGLLAYRRTGGPAGAELVADLATTIPEPSDGGRTWTFTLRPGIRYADGRAVLASHVRYGLERSLALRSQDEVYYSGFASIAGAGSCLQHPGEPCDLSEGIEVDDPAGRITFHLLRPEPGFLNLMALPLAYAVPTDVPVQLLDVGEAIPATGPYVVASYEPRTLRLVRNPQFHVWSTVAKPDGYPDEIVWTTVPDDDRRIGLVEAGEADGFSLWRFEDPAVRLTRRSLDRLAIGPWAAHTFTQLAFDFYRLRSDLPPLDDERVRRAINFAIERDVLAAKIGFPPGTETCQGLTPNMIGYRPYCPYTADPDPSGVWKGPDMEAARELVQEAGATGARIDVFVPDDHHRVEAEYFLGVLRRVGLRPRATDDDIAAHAEPTGFAYDYPSPYNAIRLGVDCDLMLLGFCDPALVALVERAARLEASDPAAAAELWASIDRQVTDDARIVPIATQGGVDVVADHVGNYQHHVMWGMLVDQLWVR